MVARARFIEDLVIREYGQGVRQYVIPGSELGQRYFTGRTDGLYPSNSEQFLVART